MIRTSLYPACSSLFFTCAGFVAQVSPCDELSAKASCGKVREITAIAMIPSILCIGALRVVECPPNELDDQVNVPLRRKVLCGIVERKRRDASAHAICSPHTLVGKGFDETRYWKKINHRSEVRSAPTKQAPSASLAISRTNFSSYPPYPPIIVRDQNGGLVAKRSQAIGARPIEVGASRFSAGSWR